ncbi:MAG: sulfatase-like hydrolase/transferase [Kiritimatiellae bacterium]|nr:sulfatase-like hydrolase/transferase [Kiritimatiellia bacterium]
MSKRPNILFLTSDEHRADVAGYEGNTVVRTPVLDHLARTGVVFRNAYAPSPICVPGRMCMMAGQLPRTCGCERYGQDLPAGHLTWPRVFAQHAYMTTACGKLHHMGPDPMQGWLRRIGMDHMMSPAQPQHIAGHRPEAFAAIAKDPDRERKWSDVKEIKRAGIGVGPHTGVWDEYATVGMEHVIREYLLDSDYDRTERAHPHVLYLGLDNPHYPYLADRDKFEYYLNRVQPFLDEQPFEHPWLGKAPFWPGPIRVAPDGDVTPREVRRATAAYYANVEACDARYGRVTSLLEQVGENLDEWIIVYTSDHGEMLGEHSIWEKQKFFEASVRVPLIVRWPARLTGGRVVQENVNQCDLFATLCELCDIPVPGGLDSRSLVPLLAGHGEGWNNETVSQFQTDKLMIKRGHLKYQYYGEKMPEVLFDLETDPKELRNVAADPAYAGAMAQFRKRRAALGHGPDADPDYVNAGY